jgi:hypothetical protein
MLSNNLHDTFTEAVELVKFHGETGSLRLSLARVPTNLNLVAASLLTLASVLESKDLEDDKVAKSLMRVAEAINNVGEELSGIKKHL